MSHADRYAALASYVSDVARKMNLRDWELHVYSDPPEGSDAAGSYEAIYGRKVAHLRFDPHLVNGSDMEELRHVVCHELVHLHLDPLLCMVETDLPGELSKSAHGLFLAGFLRHLEYAVDELAGAIAPRFPLPDFTERGVPPAKPYHHADPCLTGAGIGPSAVVNAHEQGQS